ncbi:MAG TPA: glutamate--tRNA ligase [Devosia sp.]|jgi:glutamyl-tRNA synthetase|nr:glutamate--tRNA ligase [Devosia sp.]
MTVVRWAPSPTGRIHLGNARPALLNWFYARRHGGRYVLRMDDTDLARSTRESADAIEVDLAWLGITPDLLVRQSERLELYDAARDRLIEMGRLYPCYETEEELDRKRARARLLNKPPIYDRAALSLTDEDRARFEAESRRPHWRFRLDGRPVRFDDLIKGPQTVNTASMSDPVLVREDGTYLYTLCSVVDDIELGITHVIRGEDHVSNTGTQIEIFGALGSAAPIFGHHNLLTDAEGQGFSKRLGSQSIADFRAEGYEPMAIAIMASLTGTGLPIEPYETLDEIAGRLDFSQISHGSARFDPAELDSLNARLLHALPYEGAAARLSAHGLEGEAMWLLLRDNLRKFDDIADWARLVTGPVEPAIADEDRDFLALAKALLPPEPWDETTWNHWTDALKTATGRKGKALFMPLRMALTGRHEGPELKSLLPLVGRKACLDRLP